MTVPEPPTRDGVPLRDRPIAGETTESESTTHRRRRHCWVDLTDHDTTAGEVEGLVLQWAQDARGWVALTAYVVTRAGGDITVQEWVPANRLRPAV